MIERGEVWWANLPEPSGSKPGFSRPLLIVQADSFNGSRIQTVVAIVITSNLCLADAPGDGYPFLVPSFMRHLLGFQPILRSAELVAGS